MSDPRKLLEKCGGLEALCAGLAVATTLLLVANGFLPAKRALEVTASRDRQHENALVLEDTLARVRDDLESRLEIVNARMSDLPTLGSAGDLNTRLAGLNEIASSHGLVADELSPGETVDEGTFQWTLIQFSGTATYPDFAAFLHRVHTEAPDLVISSFEVSQEALGSQSGSGRFSVEFALHALSDDG